MLYQKKILNYPLLYISEFFERNKAEYYYNFRLVDENEDWGAWVNYFIKSVCVQALDTKMKVNKMLDLYKNVKEKLSVFGSTYGIALLDIIFANPVILYINKKPYQHKKQSNNL